MLRGDLLSGVGIVVAGSGAGAVGARAAALGAKISELTDEVLLGDAEAAAAWAGARAPLRGLVFADAPGDLALTLERAWRAARAVATGALIGPERGGRLVFVAAAAAPEAARAALENLARTLSVEWARFGVTAVAVAPGAATTEAETAELVAYLLSDAGGYFSGCRFDLGAVAQPT